MICSHDPRVPDILFDNSPAASKLGYFVVPPLVVPLSMYKHQVSNGIVTVRGTVSKSPLKQERTYNCQDYSPHLAKCSPGKKGALVT